MSCYASVCTPFMIALTAASSFRAAATAIVLTNFEAFAGPAALWIASRSSAVSLNANTQRSSRDVFFSDTSTAAATAVTFVAFGVLAAAFFPPFDLPVSPLLPVRVQRTIRRGSLPQPSHAACPP